MRILFKTCASRKIGLGHLVRCRDFASYLASKSVECVFALENLSDELKPFMEGFRYHLIGSSPEETIALIKKDQVDMVVLDDYEIGLDWEKAVRPHVSKLVVLDDLQRPHDCDVLIDFKWRGDTTQTSYDDLVNQKCLRLLGPSYAIVPFAEPEKPTSKQTFDVMIGHHFFKAHEIKELADQLEGHFQINLVLGPFDQMDQDLMDHPQVKIVQGQTELFSLLNDIDLYIGTAGGIIYQLRALNIPALTFSVAENQNTDLRDLEDIGHYFHLEAMNPKPIEKIVKFIEMAKGAFDRLKSLGANPKAKIDTMGCQRIYEALFEGRIKACENPTRQLDIQKINNHYDLENVTDRHINAYLIARNHQANQMRMIETDEINRLDHYRWWFATKRSSYLLYEDQQPQLYIWHEQKEIQGMPYLIGGWFVIEKETNFQSAVTALNWQLSFCDEEFPNTPWIAVIHRENKFVQLLNKYVGFEEIPENHLFYGVCKDLFPKASFEDFLPVMRLAQNQKAAAS